MKLLILSTVLTAMYNQPTYSLLAIVVLLFISQVIGELMKSKAPYTEDNNSYQEIKDLFNIADEVMSKDIYSEEEEEKMYVDIKCMPLNFSDWSYKEIQSISKSLSISGRNRKRVVLEQELLAVCK